MAEADATTSEEDWEDMPGLLPPDYDGVSHSSEEEYVPSPPRVGRKRKKNKRARANKSKKHRKTKSKQKKKDTL